jgi:hypothetical protein
VKQKPKANADPMEFLAHLVNEPSIDILQMICDGLNKSPTAPWNRELRRLLATYHDSGPNLNALLRAEPTLSHKILEEFGARYQPTDTGRAHIIYLPQPDPLDPDSDARQRFLTITLSPDWWRFGGPCPRCQKYFIRKTAQRSIYCSQRCAKQATAIQATNKSRREKRQAKLDLAREAIAKWESLVEKRRTKKGWKQYVIEYRPDAEITATFLTQAVNKHELLQPKSVQQSPNRKEKPSVKTKLINPQNTAT